MLAVSLWSCGGQVRVPGGTKAGPLDKLSPRIDSQSFFPGAGGEIRTVTSLASNGPGSLQEAINKDGPARIVFAAGGVLDLDGKNLTVSGSRLTIAGETASSLITIIRGEVRVTGSDIRISHIAIRPGDRGKIEDGWAPDGLSIHGGAKRVLIKNCTLAWGIDESASVTSKIPLGRSGAASDILFEDCIFADSLNHSTHPKGGHSCGLLIHDFSERIGIRRSLFANNVVRNPMVKANASVLLERNVVVNPGQEAVQLQPVPAEYAETGQQVAPSQLGMLENVLVKGPSTPAGTAFLKAREVEFETEVFVDRNTVLDAARREVRHMTFRGPLRITAVATGGKDPLPYSDAVAVYEGVLASAGARPEARDRYDVALIEEIKNGRGRIKDSQEEMGGYPR